jgi:serine/threonine-protein kinase
MAGGSGAKRQIPEHARTFGKYRLLTRLATGGMAEIFLARLSGAAGFQKHLVLKRILPQYAEDEHFVAMFLDEARIAAQISHPNVCQVFELGELDGQYFMTMEYLDGVPLASLMRRASRTPRAGDVRLISGLMTQASAGLHHAHELKDTSGHLLGLVHRDVTPQNLFVTVDGVLKVLDFGVAKAAGASARTRTGSVKGKYAYMSPEQLKGEALDRRADVFALGTVLFECLTGRRLFWRDTDFLIFKAINEDPIPAVKDYRPDISPVLGEIVAKAIHRDREKRYPTVRAFGEAVAEAVAPLGGPLGNPAIAEAVNEILADEIMERRVLVQKAIAQASGDLSGPVSASLAEAPTMAAMPGAMELETTHRRGWLIAGLIVTMCIGAVAGALLWRSRLSPEDAPATVVAAPDAAPVVVTHPPVDAAPAAPPQPKVVAAPPEVKHVAPKPKPIVGPPGFVSIDSKPYATIFVDGKSVGETPLFKLSLTPGKHRVRAVSSGGGEQNFVVTVQPGKESPPKRLVW